MAATHDRFASTDPRPPDPEFGGYLDTAHSRPARLPMLERRPQSSRIVALPKMLRLDLRDEMARVGGYGESEQITLRATRKNLRRPHCVLRRCPRICGGGSKLPAAGRGRRRYDRRHNFTFGKSAKIAPISARYFKRRVSLAPRSFSPRLAGVRKRSCSLPIGDARRNFLFVPIREGTRTPQRLLKVVLLEVRTCYATGYETFRC